MSMPSLFVKELLELAFEKNPCMNCLRARDAYGNSTALDYLLDSSELETLPAMIPTITLARQRGTAFDYIIRAEWACSDRPTTQLQSITIIVMDWPNPDVVDENSIDDLWFLMRSMGNMEVFVNFNHVYTSKTSCIVYNKRTIF